MKNLINFLLKNSSWFVFILLEVFCFYLVFSGNSYQRSVFLKSSTEFTGWVYTLSGDVSSYFGLKEENQELIQKNIELQTELSALRNHLYSLESDSVKIDSFLSDSIVRKVSPLFISARVEKNSISMIENYIVINKGKSHGVKEDMGVVSQQGIVGVVRGASANYAIIQSVLNPHSKFSCRIINSSADGTLVWSGKDPRYAELTEYPKYEKFEKGDTVVTSGFSDFFPSGLLVGTVEDFKSETDDNFYSVRVKLFTDFGTLKNVLLIKNRVEEITELENKVGNVKK
ncbi:rod shape-determining protein MreC [Dysgonomonas sp. 511]|uniref:rod shape-determining protein MreC n=1 Tax=Dysgonomonas sp. 511 TaxID=2302930 RepID=UPI0013D2F7CD|nr:rod shape-determining protein MreC [Dysgonomonas sp. 511]NDV78263.1 rod shape-determining protein MreC [Dysgonomonas sp. 511]